ncbi:MAG: hypothetical protein HF978_06595 [Desulfobacteraceae bacterium]|nr:hypothetical protein [Desulfobacteraceae bacterium]MBC2755200.1 hypothetical protein [Desulfobacteraceae bacterium]
MNIHATESNEIVEADNNLKAREERYAEAMAELGKCRILELLPLAAYTGPSKGVLLDMMSGTGFVSDYLGEPFETVHAIDKMAEPLPKKSGISHYSKCDAAQPEVGNLIISKYDRVITLAGLHHLLPENYSQFDKNKVIEYRIDCLSKWRHLIKDGGRIVVGDVPARGQAIQHEKFQGLPNLDDFNNIASEHSRLSPMPFQLISESNPEPAIFFEEFVTNESIMPHIAFFESENSLSNLLQRAGYTNIKTGIHFTPWYFKNSNEAAWFIHTLFSIGTKQYNAPDLMPPDFIKWILDAVERYLGYCNTDDEGFWIGWKLLYASAENKI